MAADHGSNPCLLGVFGLACYPVSGKRLPLSPVTANRAPLLLGLLEHLAVAFRLAAKSNAPPSFLGRDGLSVRGEQNGLSSHPCALLGLSGDTALRGMLLCGAERGAEQHGEGCGEGGGVPPNPPSEPARCTEGYQRDIFLGFADQTTYSIHQQ